MHYTIKMVRKGDGMVRDSTTGYFPDAETALADGSQYLIDLFPWDDDELDANGRPKDWDFEVCPQPGGSSRRRR